MRVRDLKKVEPLFLAKILKTNSCWLWQAGKSTYGYGYICIKRKPIGAHRFSYLLYKGKIPKGMVVCHRCDTPACVNPEHLFLGSRAENMDDCVLKGRRPSKFTLEQVLDIRANKTDSLRFLARKYGVTHSAIHALKQGISHKNLRRSSSGAAPSTTSTSVS